MNAHTETYGALAIRCERAAHGLAREAARAETPAQAARKLAGVAAAQEFAARLRAEGEAGLGLDSRPDLDRIELTYRVILAAEMGGVLIDTPYADGTAAMTGSGLFNRVAETVDGRVQVPYWELGAVQLEAALAAEDAAEDDQVRPLDPDDRTTCHGCRAWATPVHLASARHNR